MNGPEDEKIIELYFSRDEKAVEETQTKYGRYCTSIAYNVLADSLEAEECVNDTWLNTWNAIPPTRPLSLRAFLARVTRNLAINRYNAMKADKRGGGEIDLVLDELAEIVSGGSGPEDEVLAKELGRSIDRFLKQLPERDANIVIKRYFYSEAVKDIAEEYSMTAGNVSVVLNRSRTKLKEYLTEEGYL